MAATSQISPFPTQATPVPEPARGFEKTDGDTRKSSFATEVDRAVERSKPERRDEPAAAREPDQKAPVRAKAPKTDDRQEVIADEAAAKAPAEATVKDAKPASEPDTAAAAPGAEQPAGTPVIEPMPVAVVPAIIVPAPVLTAPVIESAEAAATAVAAPEGLQATVPATPATPVEPSAAPTVTPTAAPTSPAPTSSAPVEQAADASATDGQNTEAPVTTGAPSPSAQAVPAAPAQVAASIEPASVAPVVETQPDAVAEPVTTAPAVQAAATEIRSDAEPVALTVTSATNSSTSANATAGNDKANPATPDAAAVRAPSPADIASSETGPTPPAIAMPTGVAAATTAAASTPATPAAPVPAAVPAMQVAVHIIRAAEDGTRQMNLRLDPPELGRVDVQVEVDHDGRVAAVVSTDRMETLDLLQRDARGLEKALQDAGLRADRHDLTFTLRDQPGEGRQHFGRPYQGQARWPGEVDDTDTSGVTAAAIAQGRPWRALDISV